MALASMTGFSRHHGLAGPYAWSWELKSVNAKGLDVKLRIPPGWDAVEAAVRSVAASQLARGSVFANLTVHREGQAPVVRINEDVLEAVLGTIRSLTRRVDASAPSLDGLLALKGVVEVTEAPEDEATKAAAEQDIIKGFGIALAGLRQMRDAEGGALAGVLTGRLDEIAALTAQAEANPGRRPEAIKARLAAQVAALMETGQRFDPDRLHQEALLLASKADIREELDRLQSHVVQARKLMQAGGPVGRKLDFLAQEFNRETNTICSKANDTELTNVGLELKAVVEQFREQVQNLE